MVAKKSVLVALSIASLMVASLLLSGCSVNFSLNEDSINDAVDSASEARESFANAAKEYEEIAEILAGVESNKATRIVVCDPKTGKTITEITDQSTIEKALMPLSEENTLAVKPDTPEEYIFELWQPETITLGKDKSDVSEEKVLEITTYKDSNTIQISLVALGNISLSMTSAESAEAFRSMV